MRLIAVFLACLCAVPAFASDKELAALDLALPQASPYRNDPPGTWYGDRSGVPAPAPGTSPATVLRRPACPTGADGQERPLTGAVTAGVGYSSNLGNSNYTAADLAYCKRLVGDDGNEGAIRVQMHVDRFDGALPAYGPRGPR
ncbi:MAG: hypothetical protein J7507_11335 [Pseudoxanthomonas sp.]|nr:hypothetical protein [Pseudoxanthomonas sp.]